MHLSVLAVVGCRVCPRFLSVDAPRERLFFVRPCFVIRALAGARLTACLVSNTF